MDKHSYTSMDASTKDSYWDFEALYQVEMLSADSLLYAYACGPEPAAFGQVSIGDLKLMWPRRVGLSTDA